MHRRNHMTKKHLWSVEGQSQHWMHTHALNQSTTRNLDGDVIKPWGSRESDLWVTIVDSLFVLQFHRRIQLHLLLLVVREGLRCARFRSAIIMRSSSVFKACILTITHTLCHSSSVISLSSSFIKLGRRRITFCRYLHKNKMGHHHHSGNKAVDLTRRERNMHSWNCMCGRRNFARVCYHCFRLIICLSSPSSSRDCRGFDNVEYKAWVKWNHWVLVMDSLCLSKKCHGARIQLACLQKA